MEYDGCNDPGCYQRIITYENDLKHIIAITRVPMYRTIQGDKNNFYFGLKIGTKNGYPNI